MALSVVSATKLMLPNTNKISILIGGVVEPTVDNEHDKNPENFVDSALELMDNVPSDSDVTVLLHYQSYIDRLGQEKADEIVDRFEQKGANVLKYFTKNDLMKDLSKQKEVDQFHYFGHGDSNRLLVSFRQGNPDRNFSITTKDIERLKSSNPNMFNEEATTVFWSCRTADKGDAGNYSNTFAYKWSRTFGIKTYGLDVRINFQTNRVWGGFLNRWDKVKGLPSNDPDKHPGDHWIEFNPNVNDLMDVKKHSHFDFLERIGLNPFKASPLINIY